MDNKVQWILNGPKCKTPNSKMSRRKYRIKSL